MDDISNSETEQLLAPMLKRVRLEGHAMRACSKSGPTAEGPTARSGRGQFKVSVDARHLRLAFEMEAAPVSGSQESQYTPETFKVVDLHDLPCDVKYEFNSDNRRLYGPSPLLMEGQA